MGYGRKSERLAFRKQPMRRKRIPLRSSLRRLDCLKLRLTPLGSHAAVTRVGESLGLMYLDELATINANSPK